MNKIQLTDMHLGRVDETDDALFYQTPRLVTHIDEAACKALEGWYKNNLPSGFKILDLMSAWVSHLPGDVIYKRVCGLGMNSTELKENRQLTDWLTQDLNKNPILPFEDDEFDACIIAVSVQYLIKPLEVFSEMARVIKPGGLAAISFSNRMFPTKAVALWRAAAGPTDHAQLISWYFQNSIGFEASEIADISPNPFETDPLYIVSARVSERAHPK